MSSESDRPGLVEHLKRRDRSDMHESPTQFSHRGVLVAVSDLCLDPGVVPSNALRLDRVAQDRVADRRSERLRSGKVTNFGNGQSLVEHVDVIDQLRRGDVLQRCSAVLDGLGTTSRKDTSAVSLRCMDQLRQHRRARYPGSRQASLSDVKQFPELDVVAEVIPVWAGIPGG
jgi:hypothetical protein